MRIQRYFDVLVWSVAPTPRRIQALGREVECPVGRRFQSALALRRFFLAAVEVWLVAGAPQTAVPMGKRGRR